MTAGRLTHALRRTTSSGLIVSLAASLALAPLAVTSGARQAAAAGAPVAGPVVGWGLDFHETNGYDWLGFPASSTCSSENFPCSKMPGAVRTDTGLGALQSVAAGRTWSAGVDASGAVWSWGGQTPEESLGRGTTAETAFPPGQVFGVNDTSGATKLSGATAVSAGYNHTIALLANGTVVGWGDDQYGQLGDGSAEEGVACRCSTVPLPVAAPAGRTGLLGDGTATPAITAIAAGADTSYALDSSGEVWSWGHNEADELGDGQSHAGGCLFGSSTTVTTPCSPVPVMVTGFGGTSPHATAIAGGLRAGYAVVGSGGNVWAWGSDAHGSLGDGTTNGGGTTPTEVLQGSGFLSGITAVTGGADYGLAVKGTGSASTVWAWGANGAGQLGNDTIVDSTKAVQVHGKSNSGFLTGIKSVAAVPVEDVGAGSSYAVTTGGGVWGWGDDSFGQLGDDNNGTTTASLTRLTPVNVKGMYSTSPTSALTKLGGIQQVAVGGTFVMAYGIAADVTLSGGCPSTAALGTSYVCTFTVANNGPATVSPSVSGLVPVTSPANAVVFTSATTTGKAGTTRLTCTAPSQGSTSGAILCPVGSMAPGSAAQTVTITFKAKLAATSTFTPSVSGAFLDLTSADNAVITTTTQS